MGTLFLSYAAADRARARDLADGLDRAGHLVRMDERLAGDIGWWSGVLADIQGADVFLFARSASSLASPACVAERDYAAALGLPILSVRLDHPPAENNDTPTGSTPAANTPAGNTPADPVSPGTSSAGVGTRNAGAEVDFGAADAAAAFRLVGAVAALPARSFVARWQPPPASPFERLADLAHDIVAMPAGRDAVIGRDDQLRLADRLRDTVERGDAPDAARELAAIFRSRPDLDPTTIRRLDTMFPPRDPAAPVAPPGSAAPVPPRDAAVLGPPPGTLTEQAVRDVAFGKPGFHRRGYDEQSVDEFLDLVEADLQTRRSACAVAGPRGAAVVVNLTPADVKAVAFVRPPFGRRGYDEQDVDLFLDEVERSFVVLDAELNRRGSPVARR